MKKGTRWSAALAIGLGVAGCATPPAQEPSSSQPDAGYRVQAKEVEILGKPCGCEVTVEGAVFGNDPFTIKAKGVGNDVDSILVGSTGARGSLSLVNPNNVRYRTRFAFIDCNNTDGSVVLTSKDVNEFLTVWPNTQEIQFQSNISSFGFSRQAITDGTITKTDLAVCQ